MTEQEAKNKIVSWAKAQIGYKEGENNWNKYAQGKESAYGWNVQNQPWCDVFVDAGFIECFGLDAARKMTYQPVFSALCSASAQNYKNNNAWYSSPEVGDQAFFYYEGGINHTGIVVQVTGGLVYTVEGNSSDMVRMGVYATDHSAIAGYGRPNWRIFAGDAPGNSSVPFEPGEENGSDTYTVQAGDTLYGISAKTGVSVSDLVQINKITNPNIIHVGDVLKLREDQTETPQEPIESSEDDLRAVALRVIRGEFGNGVIRTILLKMKGYDPAEVQKVVNQILLGR